MPSRRPGEVWRDGVRIECAKGHRIEGENLVAWKGPDGVERRACRECRRIASKIGGQARASDLSMGKPRPAAVRTRKPWLTCFTHRPGLLEECQKDYRESLAREAAQHTRAAVGRRGGQARKGKTAGRPVPTTILLGSRT